jgi:hypothetical protein
LATGYASEFLGGLIRTSRGKAITRPDARGQRLRTVPSVGPVTAAAFVATIDDAPGARHQRRDDGEEEEQELRLAHVDGRRLAAHCRELSTAGITGMGSGSTGKPRAVHRAIPPSSGCTRVIPRRRSRSATRALVASFGQEQ